MARSPTSSSTPEDKCNIVFFVLLLHGVGCLMPWNMFINAEGYFREYKLVSPILNSTSDGSAETQPKFTDEDQLEDIRKNFLSYLGVASQIPNLLFNGFNVLGDAKAGNITLRVNTTLVLETIIFVFTMVLVVVDSTQWPVTFFYITIVSVVFINMCSGLYQNCIFGTSAQFPGKYTNAVLIGSNTSGVFTSIVGIISIWLAPAPQSAAMYYFGSALVILILCLVSFNMLSLNRYFRYHTRQAGRQQCPPEFDPKHMDANAGEMVPMRSSTLSNSGEEIPDCLAKTLAAMEPRRIPACSIQEDKSFGANMRKKLSVLKKCWPQCLNVFFTFYFSLSLFPSITGNIESQQNLMDEKYFKPVACFLLFNTGAFLGNLICGFTHWPGKRHVWILVAARALFLPFFLFCNFNPNSRKWPVYINDIGFMIGQISLSLSSGYLSSITMIFASSDLSPEESARAGMWAAFFLVLGIFLGINSSFLLTRLVELSFS